VDEFRVADAFQIIPVVPKSSGNPYHMVALLSIGRIATKRGEVEIRMAATAQAGLVAKWERRYCFAAMTIFDGCP